MKLNYLTTAWLQLHPIWQDYLSSTCSEILLSIDQQLTQLNKQQKIIYPPHQQIFRALNYPPQHYQVVILGQDPYHGEKQANGLAFAVNQGIPHPPSLRNILRELVHEYNPPLFNPQQLDLANWHNQGVLLLNTSFTVLAQQANSLANIGWQTISDQIITHLNQINHNMVFLLWGNFARNKRSLIDNPSHLILEAAHPSPLSANRGFFGCNHFILTNQFLIKHGLHAINWLNIN
ncbi:MAG: hypothetical protein RLZZ293_589 [Pseudomonadota bacterium]|jgi:uracil-DNA glycosylase